MSNEHQEKVRDLFSQVREQRVVRHSLSATVDGGYLEAHPADAGRVVRAMIIDLLTALPTYDTDWNTLTVSVTPDHRNPPPAGPPLTRVEVSTETHPRS